MSLRETLNGHKTLHQINSFNMNNSLQIKFKKVRENAVAPKIANHGDAGADLTAISVDISVDYDDNNIITYGTGIAVEIPEGYVGLIFPRSSIYKKQLILSNSVGVIDCGYRGEIKFKFRGDRESDVYKIGDRIGQLVIMPIPSVEWQESEELTDSVRGEGGFGSTGV